MIRRLGARIDAITNAVCALDLDIPLNSACVPLGAFPVLNWRIQGQITFPGLTVSETRLDDSCSLWYSNSMMSNA